MPAAHSHLLMPPSLCMARKHLTQYLGPGFHPTPSQPLGLGGLASREARPLPPAPTPARQPHPHLFSRTQAAERGHSEISIPKMGKGKRRNSPRRRQRPCLAPQTQSHPPGSLNPELFISFLHLHSPPPPHPPHTCTRSLPPSPQALLPKPDFFGARTCLINTLYQKGLYQKKEAGRLAMKREEGLIEEGRGLKRRRHPLKPKWERDSRGKKGETRRWV